MTTPIPINPHTFTPNTPGDKQSTSPPRTPSHPGGGMTSNSPSSAISISPQTPFFPPPATTQNIGAASPPSANPGFFKWAQAAATLGKSPPPSSADHAQPQRGFDIPPSAHDHDDHENHDSFEFGDFDDLKQRSWTKTRRAVSMSAGPGQGASGITAMLSGFGAGAASPPRTAGPIKEGTAVGAMSMPGSGLLADKAARGQGVLRRLSMSGSSFRGNSFLSPGGGFSASLPSPPEPATAVQPSFTVQQPTNDPPKPDVGVQRAATVSGGTGRGRRYSESGGRKRGVSPMGERILRDHGGF